MKIPSKCDDDCSVSSEGTDIILLSFYHMIFLKLIFMFFSFTEPK